MIYFRILVEQNMESQNVLNSFSENKGNYRYAEGKWTVKEVIGHMMDVERIFAYRALCIARGETKPLPGMDQDMYVTNGNFNKRQLFDLNYEYRLLRESNILLFGGFDKSVLTEQRQSKRLRCDSFGFNVYDCRTRKTSFEYFNGKVYVIYLNHFINCIKNFLCSPNIRLHIRSRNISRIRT